MLMTAKIATCSSGAMVILNITPQGIILLKAGGAAVDSSTRLPQWWDKVQANVPYNVL